MKFIWLLFDQAGEGRNRLLLIALAPGIVMAIVIALVTTVSNYDQSQGLHLELMGFFALGCATVLLTMNHAVNAITAIVSSLLSRTRVQIAEGVRSLNLSGFERIGRVRIHEAVGRDLQTIEDTAPAVVGLIFFVMQLVTSALYVGYLSLFAFAVTIALLLAASYFYRRSYADAEDLWRAATESETDFRSSLDHLMDGFREVKLNAKRGEDLFSNYVVVRSGEVERLRVESGIGFNRGQTISDGFFYALMGAIVFVIPYYINDPSIPSKITLVIVFSSGAIVSIIRTLPMVARANLAVESLERLGKDLTEAKQRTQNAAVQENVGLTDRIEARALTYSYTDPDGLPAFTVGPFDLDIEAGHTTFIVGGNGSGKSTVIKLLTRLYEPIDGVITWDGTPVTSTNAEAYQGLFTVIFSDFHLFDRLYGIEGIDTTMLDALLTEMDLSGKASFRNGRFNTADLSTGQRKRLAMVVARLENRPVCIFDEWAADQDPHFRQHYYETILSQLKAEGRTVIAITHDDRYFHLADKVIWMEEGHITRIDRRE